MLNKRIDGIWHVLKAILKDIMLSTRRFNASNGFKHFFVMVFTTVGFTSNWFNWVPDSECPIVIKILWLAPSQSKELWSEDIFQLNLIFEIYSETNFLDGIITVRLFKNLECSVVLII